MKLHISLDYEMFLNDRVGTVEKSLIIPMNRILNICKKNDIYITVFVDASYLYVLKLLMSKHPSLKKDYELVEQNIKDIVAAGHDVQLHIHPQWYYCTYDGNDWTMDWEHYKLSDMPENDAFRLFKESKELLENIVGYKFSAFRAGGYSIQDFNYRKCFDDNGILVDSSVLTGSYLLSDTHYYDYRNYPRVPYKFDRLDTPSVDGHFLELPISTKRYNFFKYMILKKIRQRNGSPKFGDGGDNINRLKSDRRNKIKQYLGRPMNVSACFDWYTYKFVDEVVESYRKYGYATIISHPKNVSQSSLDYMDRFIQKMLKNGDSFITIKEYLKIINNEKDCICTSSPQ